MDSLEILTKSGEETKKLGEKLAREIAISYKPYAIRRKAYGLRQALVISLEGELGAGKTTFTQGFAKGLGVKETPKSPTFVIMRTYAICHMPYAIRKTPYTLRHKAYGLWRNFIHIDAYRIGSKDMKVLGWDEFIKKPENIILIEWGNKIKNILPKNSLVISFGHIGHQHKRLIKIYI